MTGSEFKAWLDGYCEGLDGRPTKQQIERIREKASEITRESCGCGCWHWHSWTITTPYFSLPPTPTLTSGTDDVSTIDVTWINPV